MSPLGTSSASSSDVQNIRSLLMSLALPSTQATLSQLSANRRQLGLPAAYFAAWNSNLEGGLARALSGVKCVMSMLGIASARELDAVVAGPAHPLSFFQSVSTRRPKMNENCLK